MFTLLPEVTAVTCFSELYVRLSPAHEYGRPFPLVAVFSPAGPYVAVATIVWLAIVSVKLYRRPMLS